MCEYCEHQELLTWNTYMFGDVKISEDIEIIDDKLFSLSTIEQDYEVTRWSKKINYCPMCGRKLVEKQCG